MEIKYNYWQIQVAIVIYGNRNYNGDTKIVTLIERELDL